VVVVFLSPSSGEEYELLCCGGGGGVSIQFQSFIGMGNVYIYIAKASGK